MMTMTSKMTSDESAADDTDTKTMILCQDAPSFYYDLHIKYIVDLPASLDQPSSLEGAMLQHLRMSGLYWSVAALSLLPQQSSQKVDESMGMTKVKPPFETSMVDWIFECYDDQTGGFGGHVSQDGHLLYTLSALQLLALADCLDDTRLNVNHIVKFIAGLQLPDGSFTGDVWGEVDTRFSYCALASLALLGRLESNDNSIGIDDSNSINVEKAAEYIIKCQNWDGGFGTIVGAESHAGQVFCCVGALAIAQKLCNNNNNSSNHQQPSIDIDRLVAWLCERQVDSGGLNGRPEKQADVCYSWWILSTLSMLQRVSYINGNKLARFILQCQDDQDGGIADRPDDMVDVYHTFFGIAGLSLLGYLHNKDEDNDISGKSVNTYRCRKIDPIYALPTDVVQKLKLPGQVINYKDNQLDERLSHYQVHTI